MTFRDRVKELRRVRAGELVPSPRNWRLHPQAQQDALRAVLSEIGFADALLARELPDGRLQLCDGHLRRDIAPDQEVPVLVLDLDEAEASKMILTFDPLSAMATADKDRLESLLDEVSVEDGPLRGMLDGLAESIGIFRVSPIEPPKLADGDRSPFQQMTFTVHDSQVETIKRAIRAAKDAGVFEETPNENSNGNALARLAEAYLGAG